ncbi:hypothetical protein ACFSQ7_14790 [Paenibacillus rhizoplanae]
MDRIQGKGFLSNGVRCLRLFIPGESRDVLYVHRCCLAPGVVLGAAGVIVAKVFLDAAAAYATGSIGFRMILLSLGALALMYLFYHVMDGLGNCYEEIYGLSVGKHLNLMIFLRE